MAVQSFNDCEEEVVAADSDDEMVLSSEQVVLTASDALGPSDTFGSGFRPGPCLENGKFSPSTEYAIAGHSPKVLSSVNVPSPPGSSLVPHSITHLENDNKCQNRTVFQDDEISRAEHQLTTVHDNKDCVGHMEDAIDRLYASSLDDKESPGPGALLNALEYVDKFLSRNNVGTSEIVDITKTIKEKPTSLYNLKGSHSLAKHISRRSSGRGTSSFEWVDERLCGAHPSLSNKTSSLFDFEELGTRAHGAGKEVSCSSDAFCEEKEKFHSVEKINGSTCKGSRLASDKLQANKNIDHVFESITGRNLIKEFNEESSVQQFKPGTERDNDDIFEGVFNTQMAAEVMETLLPSVDASNSAFTDWSNSCQDLSSCLTKDKTSLEHTSSKTVSFSAPGLNGKNFKRLKKPARNIRKQSITSSHSNRSHVSNTDIKTTRKRNSASINSRRHPKVDSCITGEARSSKQTQEEQTSIGFPASASLLKLEVGSFPKGKRTSRNQQRRLSRISPVHGLVTPVGSKQDTCESANSMLIREDSSRTKFQRSAEAIWGTILCDPDPDDILDPDTVSIDKEKYLINPTRNDVSVQSGRPSTFESISSTVAAEEILLSEHLSNEEFEQRCSNSIVSYSQGRSKESHNYKPCGYLKRPPRKFLVKELIRLGSPRVIPETPNYLRKRRDMVNIRVLFSQQFEDDIIKYQKKVMRRLGISAASSSLDATHFIADKFSRTRNMLEAMALGKPVVTHLWLESCGLASCFLNEKRYILRDAKKEREHGFEMPVSLARASKHPLLKGYKVFVTANARPGIEMIASLIKAVQGLVVEKLENEKIPNDIIVISCEEDYQICVPFLNKGVAVYDSELLLNGIVTQKLEYERHQLFVDHVKNRSRIVKKRRKNCIICCHISCLQLYHNVGNML